MQIIKGVMVSYSRDMFDYVFLRVNVTASYFVQSLVGFGHSPRLPSYILFTLSLPIASMN